MLRFPVIVLLALSLSLTGQEYTFKTHTYYENDSIQLQLDHFRPHSPSEKAPLVIFAHGGGFAMGERSRGHAFCQSLSENNISAVSISYSLSMKGKSFSCDGQLNEKIKAIQLAASQVRMATSWCIMHADSLGIDPSKIFLAGSSAGAEAILQAAFQNTSTNILFPVPLPADFSYTGLVAGAGAILDINMINFGNKVPALFYHGTRDPLVPYHIAPHHFCNPSDPGYMMMFGSLAIHQRLIHLNGSSHLMSYCGDGHEHANTPFKSEETQTVLNFINRVLKGNHFTIHEVFNKGRISESDSLPAHEYCR
ncbi:MAG: alpha/beta hydrolase [Bacteroidales bacterium]|nr:alpha/beta hydrolase [Bacteroidales bacterium]